MDGGTQPSIRVRQEPDGVAVRCGSDWLNAAPPRGHASWRHSRSVDGRQTFTRQHPRCFLARVVVCVPEASQGGRLVPRLDKLERVVAAAPVLLTRWKLALIARIRDPDNVLAHYCVAYDIRGDSSRVRDGTRTAGPDGVEARAGAARARACCVSSCPLAREFTEPRRQLLGGTA